MVAIAEAAERGESLVRVAPVEGILPAESLPVSGEGGSPKDQPPLETLVARIPPAVREILDELFRAKFIAVRNYPK